MPSHEAGSSFLWHGIKSILEQKFLDTRTHDEIEKILRCVTGCISAGPYHSLSELNRCMSSGRRFINNSHLPAIDSISSVDDPHVCSPCANQIHDVITVLRVEKTGPVFIRGIELCQSPGRDCSQG